MKSSKSNAALSDYQLDQLDYEEDSRKKDSRRKATKGRKSKFGKRDYDLLETSFANG